MHRWHKGKYNRFSVAVFADGKTARDHYLVIGIAAVTGSSDRVCKQGWDLITLHGSWIFATSHEKRHRITRSQGQASSNAFVISALAAMGVVLVYVCV